jgi:hypothetical protein
MAQLVRSGRPTHRGRGPRQTPPSPKAASPATASPGPVKARARLPLAAPSQPHLISTWVVPSTKAPLQPPRQPSAALPQGARCPILATKGNPIERHPYRCEQHRDERRPCGARSLPTGVAQIGHSHPPPPQAAESLSNSAPCSTCGQRMRWRDRASPSAMKLIGSPRRQACGRYWSLNPKCHPSTPMTGAISAGASSPTTVPAAGRRVGSCPVAIRSAPLSPQPLVGGVPSDSQSQPDPNRPRTARDASGPHARHRLIEPFNPRSQASSQAWPSAHP